MLILVPEARTGSGDLIAALLDDPRATGRSSMPRWIDAARRRRLPRNS